MKKSFPIRLLAALMTLAVLAVCLGCAPPSASNRNDPNRQARQDELLRWMQTDHRN